MSDLIVSDPEVGIKSYGLTLRGRQQVIQVIVHDHRVCYGSIEGT